MPELADLKSSQTPAEQKAWIELDQLETLVAFFTVGLQFIATVKMRE